LLIAESDGSCNSFESKYRWRKADRVCPVCGAAAILKSKFDDGGWFCFKKKDGCGANFTAGDPEIERQQVGRIPNPDVCDLVNTIQKMAQKRAFVGATLLAVNASEFFTQDIEDLAVDAFDGEDRSAAPAQRKAPPQSQRPAAQPAKPNGKSSQQKSTEEQALDAMLLDYWIGQKGDKTGKVYFDNVYAKKSLDEKREAAKSLGLAVAIPAVPASPAPQPVAPPAQDIIEGELIEESSLESPLSPARLEIESLVEKLRHLGCAPDEVNAKICKYTGGVYAIDDISEEYLPKVKMMLNNYIALGDRAAAEMAKEFKK
jgi:hypothetical protein